MWKSIRARTVHVYTAADAITTLTERDTLDGGECCRGCDCRSAGVCPHAASAETATVLMSEDLETITRP
ncbi:MAG: hypothetical protein U0736_11455 [Gemmataceae bacterium]